jgi:uncharacterized protein (TIGR00288 family)
VLLLTVDDQRRRRLADTLERLGYSIEAVAASRHRSGIDMTMALRVAALSSATLVLISGDSDCVPLIEHARQRGRRTVVIGLERAMSCTLKEAADRLIELDAFMRAGGGPIAG